MSRLNGSMEARTEAMVAIRMIHSRALTDPSGLGRDWTRVGRDMR